MDENKDIASTGDVKNEETTQSATSTDTKVPADVSTEPSEKTKTTGGDKTADDTTTDKPGGVDERTVPRSQQRISELVRKNRELQDKLDTAILGDDKADKAVPEPAATQKVEDTPETRKAKEFLTNLGFVAKEDYRKDLEDLESRLVLDSEHERLESQYTGDDGRPKYERDKVMKHAKDSGIYNPDAAYKNLYEPELTDWAIKQAQKAGKTAFTEKPSSTTRSGQGQIDREALTRILATPTGRKWYEDNREKILSALQEGDL